MSIEHGGCDYCYGTMGECPVCGPFEYAGSEVIGGARDAGYHVDGWDLTGRGLDWVETANARGWSWRDTQAFFNEYYAGAERLAELAFRPLGLAIGRPG